MVAYNGISRHARESAVKSEASQIGRALEVYRVNNDIYPTDASTAGAKVGQTRTLSYSISPDGLKFCAAVSDGDIMFQVSSSNTSPTEGGCDWTVSTFVGSGTNGFADGTGSGAQFSTIYGLEFNNSGDLFVSDRDYNNCLRKVTPSGVVTTVAGLCGTYGMVDGTIGTSRLDGLIGLSVDTNGVLWIADYYNHCIRRMTVGGNVVKLAGACSKGQVGTTDGTGTAARFYGPYGIVAVSSSLAYVSDRENLCIRKITSTGVVTTFAGLCGGTAAFVNGTGGAARFAQVEGMATDGAGNIYVTDDPNNCIRKITAAAVVTTYAGVCGEEGLADGPAGIARLTRPMDVAFDSQGYLFEIGRDNRVRRISPDGSIITIAGTGTAGTANGPGRTAEFDSLRSIDIDSNGVIYVGSSADFRIRKIVQPF
ncbi:MAG: hypothetical protein ACOH18_03455 [Candidatus Saccharimonadaceae bacterium]